MLLVFSVGNIGISILCTEHRARGLHLLRPTDSHSSLFVIRISGPENILIGILVEANGKPTKIFRAQLLHLLCFASLFHLLQSTLCPQSNLSFHLHHSFFFCESVDEIVANGVVGGRLTKKGCESEEGESHTSFSLPLRFPIQFSRLFVRCHHQWQNRLFVSSSLISFAVFKAAHTSKRQNGLISQLLSHKKKQRKCVCLYRKSVNISF